MKRTWTAAEFKTLHESHVRRVCALQPKWGKCSHFQCHALWEVTPETASDAERIAIFGTLLPEAAPA